MSNTVTDEFFMRRALQLARRGAQTASPNPMVGAVVVCEEKIIGEGWHRRCGEPHAEVNAIASVRDESLLPQSTIYVTLEPCSHFGKTPPCCDLIISKRIPRVVVGCVDPFEKVSGRGIARLRDAGIDVEVGVLEDECRSLNKKFFTAQILHRPYVMLKWAQSSDGFIGRSEFGRTFPVRFSTAETSQLVHRLRTSYDAVLVGSGTVVSDNPMLTARSWSGKSPLRIVVDFTGRTPAESKVFTDGNPTVLFTSELRDLPSDTVRQKVVPYGYSISEILETLKDTYSVNSLMVEGGRDTLQRFIDSSLWDEARVETSAVHLCHGIPSPVLPGCAALINVEIFSKNVISSYKRVKNI